MNSDDDDSSESDVHLFPDEALLLDTVRLLRVARVGQAATAQAVARNAQAEQYADAARDAKHRASIAGAMGTTPPQQTQRGGGTNEDVPFPPTMGTALIDRLAAEAAE